MVQPYLRFSSIHPNSGEKRPVKVYFLSFLKKLEEYDSIYGSEARSRATTEECYGEEIFEGAKGPERV
jgi:hypothetical protein